MPADALISSTEDVTQQSNLHHNLRARALKKACVLLPLLCYFPNSQKSTDAAAVSMPHIYNARACALLYYLTRNFFERRRSDAAGGKP
jgi:hypothetical protein